MRYSGVQIVFQEVPNEISLAFQITGCDLRCPGCHSSESWNITKGTELDEKTLSQIINRYKNIISCVLYLGGEWHKFELIKQLDFIRSSGLKTALYTGLEYAQISQEILKRLDYLKYGGYQENLGPLTSPISNQRLVNLNTNEYLNHYFIRGGSYDSLK